jgi:ADP-ribosyl-[dinitrogen reductase] hydrolase
MAPLGPPLPILRIAPGLSVTDLAGARAAEGYTVVSLCRGYDRPARQIWLVDSQDSAKNPHLDTAVTDTLDEIERLRAQRREVLVHCHQGRSRTGLIVRAWLQRTETLSHGEALNRALSLDGRFTPWNRMFESYLLEQ